MARTVDLDEQWTQAEAIALCREIERVCPPFGCHVALTGGLLYKDGPRKDCDIVLYRIREVDEIDEVGLFNALAAIGVVVHFDNEHDYGGDTWCIKAEHDGRSLDIFFPEAMASTTSNGPGTFALTEDAIP